MKVKTSVSLSSNIVQELEKLCSEGNRSDFIEKALWRYIELLRKVERDKRDREILDTVAPRLNAEALDILDFQAPV